MSNIITKVRRIKCTNKYNEDDDYDSAWWYLYLLNDTLVYEVNNKFNQTATMNLSDREMLYVYPGTKLVVKANSASWNPYTTNVIIEYSPDSDLCAYFEFVGDPKDCKLVYDGTW